MEYRLCLPPCSSRLTSRWMHSWCQYRDKVWYLWSLSSSLPPWWDIKVLLFHNQLPILSLQQSDSCFTGRILVKMGKHSEIGNCDLSIKNPYPLYICFDVHKVVRYNITVIKKIKRGARTWTSTHRRTFVKISFLSWRMLIVTAKLSSLLRLMVMIVNPL